MVLRPGSKLLERAAADPHATSMSVAIAPPWRLPDWLKASYLSGRARFARRSRTRLAVEGTGEARPLVGWQFLALRRYRATVAPSPSSCRSGGGEDPVSLPW